MLADLLNLLWNLLWVNIAFVGWGLVFWAIWRPGERQRQVRARQPVAYWSVLAIAIAASGLILSGVSPGLLS